MDMIKRVLALLALASMGVFIIAVLILFATHQLAAHMGWVYGPMAAFLAFGLLSLAIRFLQRSRQQAAEARKATQQQDSNNA